MKALTLFVLFFMSITMAAQEDGFKAGTATEEWLEKWENSRQYTLEAIELVPDSSLQFRPTEGQMSFQEQIQHISGNMFGLSRRFLDHQPASFNEGDLQAKLSAETLSREELVALLTEAHAFAADAVQELTEDRWEEPVENFFAGPKSRRTIVYLLQDHATHHRAQILVYLRLLGLTPPRYRGW
jgi:uncharacterized damage-inducible protein DinB